MAFEIGYSTYALKTLDPFKAVKLIADCGYGAIEICLSDDWPTSPLFFSEENQRELGNLVRELGLPSPVLFGNIDVCAPKENVEKMAELTKRKFDMGHRMKTDSGPVVITTTPGHSTPSWESGKEEIKEGFWNLAELASQNNVIIAVEAHAGTDFETPEKAVWLMEQTLHPNLTLDLDISHFVVEGSEMDHSVDITASYASMVHIKDGSKKDGNVTFCLPGEGGIDVGKFFRALQRNDLSDLPVFAEVSVQQSGDPAYDPEYVAKFCFDVLNQGRLSLEQ